MDWNKIEMKGKGMTINTTNPLKLESFIHHPFTDHQSLFWAAVEHAAWPALQLHAKWQKIAL